MAKKINLLAELKQEFATLKQIQKENKAILNYLPSELKLAIKEAKNILTENNAAIVDSINSTSYIFWNLHEEFNEKCAAGTLESSEAKQLIANMKADLQKTVKFHNNMLADFDEVEAPEEKKKMGTAISELKEEIRKQKEALDNLNMDCVIGDKPDPALDTVSDNIILNTSEIDAAYEEVIEQGIRMKTGPSPTVATNYNNALDEFNRLYEASSDDMKTKWKRAKDEVENDKAALQEKLDQAAATINEWEQQMTANGSRGYYRYAEGIINGKLVRRMDWDMQSTGAMLSNRTNTTGSTPGKKEDREQNKQNSTVTQGNINNTASTFVETYTLTADAQGNLIYTPQGNATQFTSRMKELAAQLSSPFYKDEANFDMKPGGGRDFSGNEAHSDKNSSIMLRSDDKPTPTDVEIPDWTDGKIQTMIDDYERDCAAGMVPEYAKQLKQKIQDEITIHQGNLIDQLETIHTNNGEEKETAILLDIWRKKMNTWQNIVNSLGENCMVTPTITEPCTDFETPYDTHVDLCNQNMLPRTLADRFKATMQDCIDSSLDAAKSKEDATNTYKSMKGWESNAATKATVEKLQSELDTLNAEIADQQSRLAALPPSCFNEININLEFQTLSDKPDYLFGIPKEITDQLDSLAIVLSKYPELKVTVLGFTAGDGTRETLDNLDALKQITTKDSYDVSSDYNLTVADVKANPLKYPDEYEIRKDHKDESIVYRRTVGDLAMMRAHYIKDMLLKINTTNGNVKSSHVSVKVGGVNSTMGATINFD